MKELDNCNCLIDSTTVEKDFGLNRNTIYSLVKQNRIPHVKFGSRFVRFKRNEIKDWIESFSIKPDNKNGENYG